jgi:SMC interacting uncharacterized protein involved in chromosome segregation
MPGTRNDTCLRIGVAKDVMEQIDQNLVDADYNKQIIQEQQKVIDLKNTQITDANDQVTLWKAEDDRERKAYDAEREKTKWELWGGIIGGIGLTVLAGWAIGQVHSK